MANLAAHVTGTAVRIEERTGGEAPAGEPLVALG